MTQIHNIHEPHLATTAFEPLGLEKLGIYPPPVNICKHLINIDLLIRFAYAIAHVLNFVYATATHIKLVLHFACRALFYSSQHSAEQYSIVKTIFRYSAKPPSTVKSIFEYSAEQSPTVKSIFEQSAKPPPTVKSYSKHSAKPPPTVKSISRLSTELCLND